MTAMSRICLGTVQFGLDYGVSNSAGKPSEAEVAAILARAVEAGVGYIDTAAVYGDAELLIGQHLPSVHSLRIVTKLPPVSEPKIERRHVRMLVESVEAALERLRVTRAYGLLVHQFSDLAKPGGEFVIEALHESQARGLVEKIGVSVYDPDQLALVEKVLRPQLIQVPFNVLDRRWAASGALARLNKIGTEIHVRSIFLQGLLLMEPAQMPDFFAALRGPLAELRTRWSKSGVGSLAACLAFVLRHEHVDVAVLGINRVAELVEIEAAIASTGDSAIDFDPVAIDPIYLNPTRWPTFAS